MNNKQNKSQHLKSGLTLTASAVALSLLAACGGGGGSGSTATTTSPTTSATATSIGGTVAVGDALVGANVTLIDANGNSATTTSGANGSYSIPLTGLTAPLLLVASDPSGNNAPMYSVTASVPTGSSAPLVANVTPLTTAVTAELTTDGNPLDLTNPATLAAQVTTTAVNNAISTLNTVLTPILSANSVTASSFNPINQSFTPNQTGADAVIDSVVVTPSASGGLQLASVAAPNTVIALSTATTPASTPLVAPSTSANYLATLVSQLGQCLSGTTSACSSAIDANYLENGYNSTNGGFQAYQTGISASGSTVTGVKTLAQWAAGLSPFPNIAGASALVQIFYTSSSGQPGYALTVVQQTASGAWDIIGNQEAYNVRIRPFVSQRQFLDSADAPYNRYETGLDIDIPYGAGTVNPTNLASASVTGPGISGTVWLEPRSATGNTNMSLSETALTSAPTGGATSAANTTLYRWSWQALPGATDTYVPGSSSLGYYTPTSLTTLPSGAALGVYTVTFYDSTGTQIGQPVSVVDPAAPELASAGATVEWQTLGSDVISNFLNPSGSLAAAQPSAAVDWSELTDGANLAAIVTGVSIQDGSDTSSSTPAEVDGWWEGNSLQPWQYSATVTAGVNQSGVQTCTTACQYPALQTGVSRLIELDWNAGGTEYYNIWRYKD
jgi:hypothetical protein